MANITYYIDKSNVNKKGQAPIKANICFDNKNFSKTVGRVLPSDWNNNQQRVRPPRPDKENNHDEINAELEKLQQDFRKYCSDCKAFKQPLSNELVKDFLNGKTIRFRQEKAFWDAYTEYLDSRIIEKNTKRTYKLHHDNLKKFEKSTRYRIDYDTINMIFFEKYRKYMLIDKNHGWNYFATAIKRLKFFMNWAAKQEYHNQKGYLHHDFSAPEREPTIIYLTEEELTTLYNQEFESDRLQQAKLKFLFGCFTGLAFSDIDRLTHEHIQGNILKMHRHKTNIALEIPLPDQALSIINQYQGHFKALPKLSQQKLNKYIKECCKIAKINSMVEYKDFKGGTTDKLIAPKYDLISSHVARKTFVTLTYNRTRDIELTKKLTGITQNKTLRRYLHIDETTTREALNKTFENVKPAEDPYISDYCI